MKKKILWIEDESTTESAILSGPVYASGKYILEIAANATEAMEMLINDEFDSVIVDIRIPPGSNYEWIKVYTEHRSNLVDAKLGLLLLESLFGDNPPIRISNLPSWIVPEIFGVLSIEADEEMFPLIKPLGLLHQIEKGAHDRRTMLL